VFPVVMMTAVSVVAGCAGQRLDGGNVFHSAKGYRVTVPASGWTIVSEGRDDLELRDATGRVGILVHADCDARRARRPLVFLERRLLIGLTDRTMIEQNEVTVSGWPASHGVLEADNGRAGSRMKIETFVLSDGRCVYDLVYAAAPADFAAHRDDFAAFVQSFATE